MNKIIENLKIEDLQDEAIDHEKYHVNLNSYAFYDTKSNKYDTPFFCQSDTFARRHYAMVVKDTKNIISNFQEDFDLVRLGSFNLGSGEFTHNIEVIVNGLSESEKPV